MPRLGHPPSVIHELGHAANYLYGSNTSAIRDDNENTAFGQLLSRMNRQWVLDDCFGGSQ